MLQELLHTPGTEPQLEPQPLGAAQQILVIDDDPLQGDMLRRCFVRQGYDVRVCATGQAGLTSALNQPPAIILLDIELPDINGLEICQRLVDDPRTVDVPVIVVSGSDRQQIVRESRAAGSCFFLKKPYDPNALLMLVRGALGSRLDWT